MRILLASTYYEPYLSGITQHIRLTAEHFSQNHQVTILCFKHNPNLPTLARSKLGQLPQFCSGKQLVSLVIYRLPYHLKISKGFINFFYPFYAFKYVFENDIIILHLPQFEALWSALFGRILAKKVIIMYHCDLDMGKNWLNKLIVWVVNISHFLSCLFAKKIIVYSREYAAQSPVLKHFLAKFVILSFPPYQIPLYSTDKQRLTLPEKKSITAFDAVGFVGRVAREKGLEYLLEALNLLKKRGLNIKLLVLGPYGKEVVGEEEYYKQIKALIQAKNLPVEFLGRVSKHELFAFYQKISLLVLPSINRTESFGSVQLEALNFQVPVIASDLPGINIVVKLSKYGLLSEPCNSLDLANKIEQVLQDQKKFLPNLKTVKKLFDINKVYRFYESII